MTLVQSQQTLSTIMKNIVSLTLTKLKDMQKHRNGEHKVLLALSIQERLINHQMRKKLRHQLHSTAILGSRVALGKGKMGDRPRPHLKIRPHPKNF